MFLDDIIIQNREIIKLAYTMIIGIICFFIVLRSNKLFQLSLYQGIRYFRNAFFFYGLAFVFRYNLWIIYLLNPEEIISNLTRIVFEFFLIIAGFSLLYSLIWKKFEKKSGPSSLFNLRSLIFYVMAIILTMLDLIWQTYNFLFLSQIIVFGFATALSYVNCRNIKKESNFIRIYFFVMILMFFVWLLNFSVAYFFNWNIGGVIGIYVLNMIIFVLISYGVIKVTKKSR